MDPYSTKPNLGEIYRSSSGTRSSTRCSNRRGNGSTCTHGACSKSRRSGKSTIGGKCRVIGGSESLQFSWGGDETGLDDQLDDQTEELEENERENPMEILNNVEALTAEAEAGAALDAATAEVEDVRAMITEENMEVLTIEYSLEWG